MRVAEEWPRNRYIGTNKFILLLDSLAKNKTFTMFTLCCADCGTSLTRTAAGSHYCHPCGWPYA